MTAGYVRVAVLLTFFVLVVTTVWPWVLGPKILLPGWAAIPGTLKLCLFGMALATLMTNGRDRVPARRVASGLVAVGAASLAAWLLTGAFGVEVAGAFWSRIVALRPGAVMAIGITAAALSLRVWNDDSERLDASVVLGMLAAGAFFLVLVGHLYGATSLTAPPLSTASTGLGAALFFALSAALLAQHPAGPMQAYRGDGPGPVARRRLLPAAVLTPIASGFLLVAAVTGQYISPTLAVALVVFANVVVMLLLIDGAGSKVAQVAQDREARVEAREAQARKQGMRDAMTALLNRRGWDAEVQAAERRCKGEKLDACVVVIDLDGLKQVNDREGHKAGDAYIQRAAAALRKAARRGDTLARLGGDEFAYLVVGCDDATARAVVARFDESLRSGRVNASVGYSMRGGRTVGQAFEEADQAMYQQKRARKLKRA